MLLLAAAVNDVGVNGVVRWSLVVVCWLLLEVGGCCRCALLLGVVVGCCCLLSFVDIAIVRVVVYW